MTVYDPAAETVIEKTPELEVVALCEPTVTITPASGQVPPPVIVPLMV